MTLNINRFSNLNLYTSAIAPLKNAPFFSGKDYSTGVTDTFAINSELAPYLSTDAIKNMVAMNPKITKILISKGIPLEINIKELNKLANGHLKKTKDITAGIINNLPTEIKGNINRQATLQAAMFHDFGKVLIPDKVLNKKGALNDKEREIMNIHSELGFELLKTQNISPKALELIKYHHQNKTNTGYPENQNGFEYGIESEIITLADKFSALTEKRPYKPALSEKEALAIIQEETGSSPILDALIKFVTEKQT